MAYGWDDDEPVGILSCEDGWNTYGRNVTGQCPSCEGPITVDGEAAAGCYNSPVTCAVCGSRPCKNCHDYW